MPQSPIRWATQFVMWRCDRRKECAREGVLLAKQLIDQLIYGQDDNEVLLIKYLDSVDSAGAGFRVAADSIVRSSGH